MTDKTIQFIKTNYKYILPLLVPLAALYALSFIDAVTFILEILINLLIAGYFLSLSIGVWLGLVQMSHKDEKIEFMNTRLVHLCKPIQWGYDLVSWLTQDLNDETDTEDGT